MTDFLQIRYQERDDINQFVRKVMTHPLLPAEHIHKRLITLSCQLPNNLSSWTPCYVEDTWMTSNV